MKTVLVLTGDALFGSIILHKLKRRGASVLTLSDAAKAEDYLRSGEITLMIVDTAGEPIPAAYPERWLAHAGVSFIIAGESIPAGFPRLSVDGRRIRRVPRQLLVRLVQEIVVEAAPGLLSWDPTQPFHVTREDRRGAPRSEKTLRVFLSKRPLQSDQPERSRTLDISASGARIVTEKPLKPDAHLDMSLLLPSFSETVPLRARVVWSKPLEDQRHHLSGVFFDWFSEIDRHKLTHVLTENYV